LPADTVAGEWPSVLSIGKLGRGAEGYYLQAVAKGVEDYYLGSGEALGRWAGSGSARLGLSGVVNGEELRAVLDGRRPVDCRSLLWQRRDVRLPGFDLTFSAPKGVSLLFALSDTRTSLLVREAHDRAVAAALGYLEREAGEVRRGKDGVDRLPGGGFVAAAFRHRTSRAGDPQLHTHVLVANMTRGQDGRWTALDGRQLYWQAKTAGTLYQTALRHELRALGLRFVLQENGLCELADVPRTVLRAFSRRRVEIETELTRRGESSRAAAQVATLATRKAKDYGVPAESLATEWHSRAEALGFDAAARERLLGRTTPVPPSRDVLAQAAMVMLGPGGLTARLPVFDRRDALRAWCAQLPGGAPVEYVEQLADTLLDQPEVIPVDRPDRVLLRPGAARSLARHTTTDMLATEITVLNAALAARDNGRAVVADNEVDQAMTAHPLLSAEQREMLRRLTTLGGRRRGRSGQGGNRQNARAGSRPPGMDRSGPSGDRRRGRRPRRGRTDRRSGHPGGERDATAGRDRAGAGSRHPWGDPGRRGADRRRGRHARHPPNPPAPRGIQPCGRETGAGRGPRPAARTGRRRNLPRPRPGNCPSKRAPFSTTHRVTASTPSTTW
jgi:conjugative relaxase domain, TrwC/TraI family